MYPIEALMDVCLQAERRYQTCARGGRDRFESNRWGRGQQSNQDDCGVDGGDDETSHGKESIINQDTGDGVGPSCWLIA